MIGISVELGRPGIGTWMNDIEKVAQAIFPLVIELKKENPTYILFEDPIAGKLRDDIRGEKVLSAILEFRTTEAKAARILKELDRVAKKIDTVFSVNMASMLESNG